MQSREESGAKMTVYMSRKDLTTEVERLREYLLGLKKITPHKWLRDEINRIIKNDDRKHEELRDAGVRGPK